MSQQQHTDVEPASDDERSLESCQLERFSRNRYFNGKLMTARDMQAEQEYHAGRLETLVQHVVGEGVVCGLETSLTADDGGIEVSVEPGVAVDSCGRLIVVDGADKVPFPPGEVPDSDDVSVFIELDPCDTEKVPKPGSQDACSENCEYNRVVEDYHVRLAAGPPHERKPIPDVGFPSHGDITDEESRTDPHHALSEPPRTYYGRTDEDGAFRYTGCSTGGDASVFLGYYEKTGTDWERQEETEPRHHVYSNDMLYAGLSSHTSDFRNPHEVELDVEQLGEASETIVRNQHPIETEEGPPYPGDVSFTSPDDTLAIAGSSSDGVGSITLDLGDDEQESLGRVDPLESDLNEHLGATNPHDVVAALAGDGERVEPGDGVIDLVSGDGITVHAEPDEHELGIDLEAELLEELVHDFLEELIGPFDAEDWEMVRAAIRNINGVESDDDGGIQLGSQTETVAIDEDEDDNSISIDIDEAILERLDDVESRLDALESEDVDIGEIDLGPWVREEFETIDFTEYLDDYEQIRDDIDRIDPIIGDIEDLTTQFDNMDTRFDNLDTQVQEVDSQIATLDSEIQGVDTHVTTLDSQVQDVNGEVATLNSEIENVDGRVESLNGDLASTASNLSALSTNLQDEHNLAVPNFEASSLTMDLSAYSDVIVHDNNFDYHYEI